MNYYSVRFKFEDDYYMTAYCKANNKKEMFVRYDDKYIRYIDDDLEELELAYALTIHKSQGSEWQYVLVPMLRQHYAMLNKHILYTAITRAKVGMYLFAQKSAQILPQFIANTKKCGLGFLLTAT